MDNEEIKEEQTSPPATEETAEERATREREEYLQGWQRAKADFSNYKRDETKRLEEFARYQAQGMIREFLTVLDSFDLAIAAMKKDGGGDTDEGISLIRSQMEDVLRRQGVTKITIALGSPFDPAIAEAIAEIESELPEGSVVEEVGAGYTMGDKVIRSARVVIAKEGQ